MQNLFENKLMFSLWKVNQNLDLNTWLKTRPNIVHDQWRSFWIWKLHWWSAHRVLSSEIFPKQIIISRTAFWNLTLNCICHRFALFLSSYRLSIKHCFLIPPILTQVLTPYTLISRVDHELDFNICNFYKKLLPL